MYSIEERLQYKKYVTASFLRNVPIYNWYTFPHSFSPDLVHALLAEFSATPESMVFDPFVGAGTTLLACREKGISAFGVDQLPFSVFVSNAKIRNYNYKDLYIALSHFKLTKNGDARFRTIPIWDKAFSVTTKRQIEGIYGWISSLPDRRVSDFFTLSLLSLLEEFSFTTKSGGWLRLVNKEIEPAELIEKFIEKSKAMISDICKSTATKNRGSWYAMPGDARHKHKSAQKADIVISSPPYLNRHDYTRIFSLEMALHFVVSNEELIAIRKKSLRSHVEAKPPSNSTHLSYCQPPILQECLEELKERLQLRDKRRITCMVQGYFEDMFMTLHSISHRLTANGKVAFVISNVRFSGVTILVDEILAKIGEQAGLMPQKIIVARYRGNSSQQMGLYGREPVRESVVIWQKAS
jgi:hypothetical protein